MSQTKYQATDFSEKINSDLPFDIISDILSRLSVKPLLRFKSVSKTWYALIENPHFIKKHHTRSKQNFDLTSVLVTELRSLGTTTTFPPDPFPKTYNMRLECKNNKTVNLGHDFSFEDSPRVLGICDGLVCFTLKYSEIYICNPTTRSIRKILGFSLPSARPFPDILGFVFHDNEYKLLRLVRFRAEVYSMSTNIWREIEVNTQNIDTRIGVCLEMPVTINEVFYWLYYTKSGCVVSFDMNGYNFGTIDYPKELTTTFNPQWLIHNVNGKLAMTIKDYKWFKMLVLSEKEKSWTMKLKIDYLSCTREPGSSLNLLGCDRNGNLIMQHLTSALDILLLTYDPESHKITYLPFRGLEYGQAVYVYTESLLLV